MMSQAMCLIILKWMILSSLSVLKGAIWLHTKVRPTFDRSRWNFLERQLIVSPTIAEIFKAKQLCFLAIKCIHYCQNGSMSQHLSTCSAPQHLLSTIVPIWCLEPALSPLLIFQIINYQRTNSFRLFLYFLYHLFS